MQSDSAIQIAVLIPSRLDRQSAAPNAPLFLADAVASVRRQVLPPHVGITIYVGLDDGVALPPDFPAGDDIVVARSAGRTQGDALNAMARLAVDAASHVTFLEDDDVWHDHFAACALEAVKARDFVSSTQLEIDERGQIARINDFPTPSGWFMPAQTFKAVGAFDVSFRWHLDNDWLGRLNQLNATRGHLVEATAPTNLHFAAQVRPWLAHVIKATAKNVELIRHSSLSPLITRRIHSASGMSRIAQGGAAAAQSQSEYQRLTELYQGVPW